MISSYCCLDWLFSTVLSVTWGTSSPGKRDCLLEIIQVAELSTIKGIPSVLNEKAVLPPELGAAVARADLRLRSLQFLGAVVGVDERPSNAQEQRQAMYATPRQSGTE
jgi:hypothetical protein